MSATHVPHPNTPAEPVLYVAFELSGNSWKLAFTTGSGQAPRFRSIAARNTVAVLREIADAKPRFGLPDDTRNVSCYEAGRDGFWLHRVLAHAAVENVVVDSVSVEVNRRKRRANSDRLDVIKLLPPAPRGLTPVFHGLPDQNRKPGLTPASRQDDERKGNQARR